MDIYRVKTLVTLDIYYYLPDYPSLLNEFIWQMDDVVPEMIRVHRFLWHWKKNVNARLNEVLVAYGNKPNWRRLDGIIE